jgi:hypothetical protein
MKYQPAKTLDVVEAIESLLLPLALILAVGFARGLLVPR